MRISILSFLLFAIVGCGTAPRPEIAIPPDADLKADVMMTGTGRKRSVEISFYFSRPVAPGDKTGPKVDVIPVDEVRFNDEPLAAEVNQVGRDIYTGRNLEIKAENIISIKLNGKAYEARAIPQTTLANKSVTAVMTPK